MASGKGDRAARALRRTMNAQRGRQLKQRNDDSDFCPVPNSFRGHRCRNGNHAHLVSCRDGRGSDCGVPPGDSGIRPGAHPAGGESESDRGIHRSEWLLVGMDPVGRGRRIPETHPDNGF